MSALWDILDLLSSPPGALIYYLILLLGIWAIVGLALSRWSRGERGGLFARLLLAGALMSFSRFLLFVLALLSRQGVFSLIRFSPPLERFIDTLSALLIGWAFVFPHRYRIASRLTIGVSVFLTIVLYVLSAASWISILDTIPLATYNGSTFQSRVWEAWQLLILIPAFVYTLFDPARERDTLNIGLGVLIAGHLAQLVYPLADRIDHLSAWSRLANLVAFPLFAAATYQLVIQHFDAQTLDMQDVNRELLTQMADLKSVLDAQSKVSVSLDLETVLQDGVQWLAQILQSDLCALALVAPPAPTETQPDTEPQAGAGHSEDVGHPADVELAFVYDAPHLFSDGQRVCIDEYPALQRAMAQSSPLILQTDGHDSLDRTKADDETRQIYRLLGSDQGGPLLIQPLEHASTMLGAILACRIEDQVPFTPGQVRKSEALAPYLSTAIESARQYQELQARLEQLAAELDAAETRHTRLRTDLENRLTRTEEQATLYMQRLYEAELGEQQAQEDARQVRRKLALLRQDSQAEISHVRDELKHSIQQATHLTDQIADLDARCLELGNLVHILEQEKGLLQLRLAVVATEPDETGVDAESQHPPAPLLAKSGSEAASTHSANGLLAALTQDLCAPMASILEYTELFVNSAADRLDNRQIELLKRVQANSERMQGMLSNLLSLGAMERGPLVLKPAPTDIAKVIQVALDRNKFRLEEKELKTRLEIGILPTPRVDPGYMQQIVDNLVSYACRSFRARSTVDIHAYAENGDAGTRQLCITLADTGPDLDAQEPGRSTEGQHRSTDTTRSEPETSRTERKVIRALVEAHGGQIRYKGEPGTSIACHLTIPVEPAHTSEQRGKERV